MLRLNSNPFPHVAYARGWKGKSSRSEESLYAAKGAVLQTLLTALTDTAGVELVYWDGTARSYFQ